MRLFTITLGARSWVTTNESEAKSFTKSFGSEKEFGISDKPYSYGAIENVQENYLLN
jgi:hypothetical protein